jgi:hypothetical protein
MKGIPERYRSSNIGALRQGIRLFVWLVDAPQNDVILSEAKNLGSCSFKELRKSFLR